jgi:hypothetical protein
MRHFLLPVLRFLFPVYALFSPLTLFVPRFGFLLRPLHIHPPNRSRQVDIQAALLAAVVG